MVYLMCLVLSHESLTSEKFQRDMARENEREFRGRGEI